MKFHILLHTMTFQSSLIKKLKILICKITLWLKLQNKIFVQKITVTLVEKKYISRDCHQKMLPVKTI